MLQMRQRKLQNTTGVLRATRVLRRGDYSALGLLGTAFNDWVSILWGEGTRNDGMRETMWVLGKYPNGAVYVG